MVCQPVVKEGRKWQINWCRTLHRCEYSDQLWRFSEDSGTYVGPSSSPMSKTLCVFLTVFMQMSETGREVFSVAEGVRGWRKVLILKISGRFNHCPSIQSEPSRSLSSPAYSPRFKVIPHFGNRCPYSDVVWVSGCNFPELQRLFFCSFWSKLSVGISWHQHFRSGFLACGTLSRSGRDMEGIQMLPLESSQVFGILQETRLQGLEPLPSILNKRVLYIFSNTPPRMYPDLHVVQSYDLELVCFCCSTTPVH